MNDDRAIVGAKLEFNSFLSFCAIQDFNNQRFYRLSNIKEI